MFYWLAFNNISNIELFEIKINIILKKNLF